MADRGLGIVTGASSGIGRAVALRLSRSGRRIIAVGRRAEALAELVSEIERTGGSAIAVVADLADSGGVGFLIEQLVHELRTTGRSLDVLVSNAGITTPEDPLAASAVDGRGVDADSLAIYDINLIGAVRVLRRVVPFMSAGGTIVQVSSRAALCPLASQATYSATKAAQHALSAALADELIARRLRITSVLPGSTATDILRSFPAAMQAALGIEKEARLHADDVAAAVGFAVDAPPAVRIDSLVLSPLGTQTSRTPLRQAVAAKISAGPKRVLVTGATSSSGFSTVQRLLREGHEVILAGPTTTLVNEALARCGSPRVHGAVADLATPAGVAALFAQVDAYGPVHVVVNNASSHLGGPFFLTDEEELVRLFDINARAVLLVARAALRRFRERAGVLINVAANLPVDRLPGLAAYSASQGFVHALSSALHEATAGTGVTVACIAPDAIDTGVIDKLLNARLKGDLAAEVQLQ